jgi:hypothetical protein
LVNSKPYLNEFIKFICLFKKIKLKIVFTILRPEFIRIYYINKQKKKKKQRKKKNK